jgi:hypothetical protein
LTIEPIPLLDGESGAWARSAQASYTLMFANIPRISSKKTDRSLTITGDRMKFPD